MMMLSTNQSNPMKAMICVMKALIKNVGLKPVYI